MSAALGSGDGTYGGLPSFSPHQYSWKGLIIESGSVQASSCHNNLWGAGWSACNDDVTKRQTLSVVEGNNRGAVTVWLCCPTPWQLAKSHNHSSYMAIRFSPEERDRLQRLLYKSPCTPCCIDELWPPYPSWHNDTCHHSKECSQVCWRHSSQAWLLEPRMSLILIYAS